MEFEGSELLARCVRAALDNLTGNTVPGRGPHEPALFLRAGGGYSEPWTRDAAVNAWLAASWLSPEVAGDTLRMVCDDGPDGPVIAQDNQWWDQVVWVIAADRHALLSGDREFLRWAEGVARRSLAIANDERFVETYGLFRGPAVMADGISGYPGDVVDPGNESSFVLDHPRAHEIFCLSTNLVHAAAYAALGEMRDALDGDGTADRERARSLVEAVETRFRSGDSYGYLLIPRGPDPVHARLDLSQEVLGLAFLLLGGVVDRERAQRLIDAVHREPYGVVPVWPALQSYTMEYPGRHNVISWPWITGVWVQAVAVAGDLATFGAELDTFLRLIEAGSFAYPEVQDAQTGVPDGGWQRDALWTGEYLPGIGRHWESEPDQTWSATALLGVVLGGLLGLTARVDGLQISPRLPPGHGRVRWTGIRYGAATLDVEIVGNGDRLVALVVDGVEQDLTARLPLSVRDGAPRTVTVRAVVAP